MQHFDDKSNKETHDRLLPDEIKTASTAKQLQ